MKAYLPLENYIKKRELPYGVGLLISTSEEQAKSLTSRKKNVCSFNQWLEADIPEDHLLLNINKPLYMQSQSILDGLKQDDFILTLFISEARHYFMQNSDRVQFEKAMTALKEEKFQILSQMTGINQSQISHYISGYCEPKQDNFYLIANVLNVDYGWLMGYDVPMDRETEKHLKLRENIKEKLIIATDEELEKILQYTIDIGIDKRK